MQKNIKRISIFTAAYPLLSHISTVIRCFFEFKSIISFVSEIAIAWREFQNKS